MLALLMACSEAPEQPAKAKEPPKPPEAVGALKAFYQIYAYARSWATDIQILHVSNVDMKEVKSEPGKAGAWRVTLVSPSQQRSRTFTYSVIEAEGNLHKGVFGLQHEAYSQSGQAKPFPYQALKVDSDKAYAVAASRSAEYMKKNPNKAVNFQLELTPRCKNPAWRVFWGESISTSNYSILVDASTGEFCQTLR